MTADRSWVRSLHRVLDDLEAGSTDPMVLVNIGRWLGRLELADVGDLEPEYRRLGEILRNRGMVHATDTADAHTT